MYILECCDFWNSLQAFPLELHTSFPSEHSTSFALLLFKLFGESWAVWTLGQLIEKWIFAVLGICCYLIEQWRVWPLMLCPSCITACSDLLVIGWQLVINLPTTFFFQLDFLFPSDLTSFRSWFLFKPSISNFKDHHQEAALSLQNLLPNRYDHLIEVHHYPSKAKKEKNKKGKAIPSSDLCFFAPCSQKLI